MKHTDGLHDLVDEAAGGALSAPPEMADLVRRLLVGLGEDVDRDGLKRTPERVANALMELTKGYHMNVEAVLNGALFEVT
jgi:GTP cyclohydrolase IA